jgi:hypothetical protein
MSISYAMTLRYVGMLCISITQTALRKNAQLYILGLLSYCLATMGKMLR